MSTNEYERDGHDIARLVLRAAIGSTMIAHGVKHARTLEGTARWFDSIGFRQPAVQAQTSAAVEIASGAALIAGFAMPVAASAVVGTMTVAARSVHVQNGFFVINEGYEYVLVLAAASTAAAALGSGRFGVDARLPSRFRKTGRSAGLIAAILGVAGGCAQLAVFWRRPPAATT